MNVIYNFNVVISIFKSFYIFHNIKKHFFISFIISGALYLPIPLKILFIKLDFPDP